MAFNTSEKSVNAGPLTQIELRQAMTTESKSTFDVITLTPGTKCRVHVVDASRSNLVMTIEQAVRACHAYESQLKFQHQFETLLDRLGQWWEQRRAKIEKAWVTVRDTGLLFVVVQKEVQLDQSLEDDVTCLVSEVLCSEDFSLIRLEAITLPRCEGDGVSSFVNSKATVELALNA